MLYLFAGLLLWYILIFIYKTKTGSPSVWSREEHIGRLVKYVKPGMRVADLGCGDGRILIAAVAAGARRGEGWEIEPIVWLKAKLQIRNQEPEIRTKLQVHFSDMWKADLSQFDLVYVYQLTRYASRFVKKCRAEMLPGTLVIANTYPLDGLKLTRKDGELFVYMI